MSLLFFHETMIVKLFKQIFFGRDAQGLSLVIELVTVMDVLNLNSEIVDFKRKTILSEDHF